MRTIGVLPKSVLILEYLGMILLAFALLSLNHYLTLPAPFNTPLAGVLMVFLGGVYIGGIRNNIESVTELLKLPKHVLPLFGLCLGWPADNPDLKPRLPAELVVHENQYQPLDEKLLARYDEQLAEYYLTRGSNTRRDTWSDHIRRTLIKENRPFILEYLHKQGWATR